MFLVHILPAMLLSTLNQSVCIDRGPGFEMAASQPYSKPSNPMYFQGVPYFVPLLSQLDMGSGYPSE